MHQQRGQGPPEIKRDTFKCFGIALACSLTFTIRMSQERLNWFAILMRNFIGLSMMWR